MPPESRRNGHPNNVVPISEKLLQQLRRRSETRASRFLTGNICSFVWAIAVDTLRRSGAPFKEMDHLERLRPVGRLERFSTARHDLKFYLNAAVTASYSLPGSSSLPLGSYIHEACRILVGQHSILSAIPVDEDTNDTQFVRLPEVQLENCVLFQERCESVTRTTEGESNCSKPGSGNDPELDELLNIQHNKPFTPPDPFWRLCILTDVSSPREFTAAFVFHHALADGASGMAFHRTFREALSMAVRKGPSNPPPVIPSPSTPLLPNVEALHPMPVSLLHLVTVVFKEKVWSRRDPGLWTGSKIFVPLENQIRHLSFSQHETKAFVDLCRAHATTLTAALQTVIAGVLFREVPQSFTELQCTGAMNTRRWLPNPITDDSLGVFVQDLSETYSRDAFRGKCLPWPEAKRSRDTLRRTVSAGGKNAAVNMLRYVRDFQQELFLSKIGQERGSSFEVSNVGVLKVDKSGDAVREDDVEIGRMVFSQSANVAGNAFQVSAVTGGDGCLVLAFSWQKGVVEDALVEKVMEMVRKEILAVVREGSD